MKIRWAIIFFSSVFWGCSEKEALQEIREEENPHGPRFKNIKYAKNFSIEKFSDSLRIKVSNPWKGSELNFTYVLQKNGGLSKAEISVPVKSFISLSSPSLGFIQALSVEAGLKAVDELRFVSHPKIREKILQDQIAQVRVGGELNIEKVLELHPEAVFLFATGDPKYDFHQQLERAGIRPILTSGYMEESPLGRAEWIKFFGAFFDREYVADSLFHEMETEYNSLKNSVVNVKSRPTVFSGAVYGGVWHVPGGKSFAANLFADAGAQYLWGLDKSTGSLPLSMESVFATAVEADFWLHPSHWKSLQEGLIEEPRYRNFRAFSEHSVYNNNARLNTEGGNGIYEEGIVDPQGVLRDLIRIFHPEILPNHQLKWYRKLE